MTDHPRAAIAAIPLEHHLSPITGWSRAHHEALATASVLALRRHASPNHAGILPPGPLSRSGRDSDALEGFARSFLAAGYLLAGGSADPNDLAGWYARGVVAGTAAGTAESWPRLADVGQARVEAAAVSMALHDSREQIWNRLSSSEQERVIEWLSESTTASYPSSNWVLFFTVTQAFLRSVGAEVDETRVAESLAFMADCHLGHGWYSDGSFSQARPELTDRPRWPQVDWYNSWVIHHFFLWYHRMSPGTDEVAAPWIERLGQWADTAIDLFGADGAPLFQGRSLTYRFGMLSALVDAAAMGVGPSPGRVRRVASATLQHFVSADSFSSSGSQSGVLSLGWFGPHERMRQSYSGPGSPYWAMHGFSGLAWPSDNPLWSAVEQPSRVESGPVTHRIDGCHWLISSPSDDGLVRVLNHGVDHVTPGSEHVDPLYDRLAYSTATAPVERSDDDQRPADNEVLIDLNGRRLRRRILQHCQLDSSHPIGRSRWSTGSADDDPQVAMVVLQHGQVELRFVRVDGGAGGDVIITGWPITAGRAVAASIHRLVGDLTPGSTTRVDEQPLGRGVTVDWLRGPVTDGWVAVAVVLRPDVAAEPVLPTVTIDTDLARVSWPDGEVNVVELT